MIYEVWFIARFRTISLIKNRKKQLWISEFNGKHHLIYVLSMLFNCGIRKMKIPLPTIESPPTYEFSFPCIVPTIIQGRVMKVRKSTVKYIINSNVLSKRLGTKLLIKGKYGIHSWGKVLNLFLDNWNIYNLMKMWYGIICS